MVEGEVEAVGIGDLWPAQQRIGAIHAVPGQLAGDGPVHAHLQHIAGLNPRPRQANGVLREDLLRERHRPALGMAHIVRGLIRGGGHRRAFRWGTRVAARGTLPSSASIILHRPGAGAQLPWPARLADNAAMTRQYRSQTAAETFDRIRAGTTPWVAMGDFLDDWRRLPVAERPPLVAAPLADAGEDRE